MQQFMSNLLERIFDHSPEFFQNVIVEISSFLDVPTSTTVAGFLLLLVIWPIKFFLTERDE